MFNSINVSLALDPSQELSLDDLDLVLGGNNAVSAAGSGDDPQQQGGVNVNATPVNANVNVDISSNESHNDGHGPLDTLANAVDHAVTYAGEALQTVEHVVETGRQFIENIGGPTSEALGQLGHDVIMAIDHAVTGNSSTGTGG